MMCCERRPAKRWDAMKNHPSACWVLNRPRRPMSVANAALMGGKKVNGRKRQFWVDTNGFLLRVLVHPANISDTEGAEWLLEQHHRQFPRMKELRVDEGY